VTCKKQQCEKTHMGIHITWMSVDPSKRGKGPCMRNFFGALNFCPRPVYPNVHVLLQLLATLPVSTAELERMLSKVDSKSAARCLKTRLEAVVLMQAHRQQVTELATNDIIDKFAACGSRKLKFSFPLQCYYQSLTSNAAF